MNGLSHIFRRCVPPLLLVLALGCGASQKDQPVVVPVATPEAIALIQDNRERCAKLGETGLTVLQSAERVEAEWTWNRNERRREREEDQPSRPQEANAVLKEHLEGDAAPEVAAAKKAAELIDKLLPKIAEETSPQIAQAVDALNRAQEALCDRVVEKDASAWTYERNRRRAIESFESAEAKLEALYQASATDLQFAMRKYNPLLEQARSEARRKTSGPELTPEEYAEQQAEWEAVQELQTVQQAEHEVAVSRWREENESEAPQEKAKVGFAPDYAKQLQESPESRQQAFQSWYPSYSARATPVRQALAHYVNVRRGPQTQVQPACQAILDATVAMLNDPQALQVPDKLLTRTLKQAYENLQQGATACVAGRTAEAAFRMTDYEKGIKEATGTLGQYSMVP